VDDVGICRRAPGKKEDGDVQAQVELRALVGSYLAANWRRGPEKVSSPCRPRAPFRKRRRR